MKLLLKILVPVILLLVAVFITIDWFSVAIINTTIFSEEVENLSEQVHRASRTILIDANARSEKLSAEKWDGIADSVRDPSIFRVKVWGSDGRIIYSDLEELIGSSGGPPDRRLQAMFERTARLPDWKLVTNPDPRGTEAGFGAYLDILFPILGNSGRTSYVLELFSATSKILSQRAYYTHQLDLLLLLESGLLLIGMYIILRHIIIRPLQTLQSAMEDVGRGDLERTVQHSGNDEIGHAYTYFNIMRLQLSRLVTELKESKKQIEQSKAGIERTVRERTRELHEEHARLAASINSLTLGFFLVAPDGQIMTMNPQAQTMLHCADRPALDDVARHLSGIDLRASIFQCMEQKRPLDVPDVAMGTRAVHVLIAPIILHRAHEGVIGAVVLLEDITEQKIMERAKNEFISITSHELRTPLTIIKWNASVLKECIAPGMQNATCNQIIDDLHDSAEYLIGIVNLFLETSTLEQGKFQVPRTSFDLLHLTRSVLRSMQPLIAQKKLTSSLRVPPGITGLPVFANADRVKQVLINLIDNAIKFTEKGGITIAMETKDALVMVSVEDTGIGIPPQAQNLLFRKFQQASDNILTRDHSRSMGLGLYICKVIIESMGGTIRLERSEEGKGSTFVFTLPSSSMGASIGPH